MANLLLTQRCVRACPYCFAQAHMAAAEGDGELSWENLIYVADFLIASGERRVSLLGGEPTLHARFVDYLTYLCERGFHTVVFTSGILSDARIAELDAAIRGSIPPDRLHMVCNINDPGQTPAKESDQRALTRFLEVCGPWCSPGFNIYRPDFQLDYVLHCVNAFGMKRSVRLGLAHPIPGASNAHIRPEQMRAVAAQLHSQIPALERHRVRLGLDCGFPLCQFDDAQIAALFRASEGGLRFGCGPAIDIGPDLSVWSCFPLSRRRARSLLEFSRMGEVIDFFHQELNAIRAEYAGIYDECDGCRHRASGLCSGGCVSHLLMRMQDAPAVRPPIQ